MNPRPPKSEVRIEQLADKSFLERTSKELLDTYAKVGARVRVCRKMRC